MHTACLNVMYDRAGDSVMVSDPEGTFDAQAKLAPACDVLLVAAGSGGYYIIELIIHAIA